MIPDEYYLINYKYIYTYMVQYVTKKNAKIKYKYDTHPVFFIVNTF